MDLVGYLENWVEKGVVPPDAIPQTLKEPNAPYTVIRSRPLCRYPKYPRYNGSGDPDRMESYTCAAP
jgi:feruloyl esterase